jgi:hypothetical protein
MNKIAAFDLNMGAITQNGSATSVAIDLGTCRNAGRFSVQYIMTATGAPTIQLDFLASNDGINYVAGTAIATGQAKGTSLPLAFTPPLCRFMKIKATEENVAAVTGLRVILAVQ